MTRITRSTSGNAYYALVEPPPPFPQRPRCEVEIYNYGRIKTSITFPAEDDEDDTDGADEEEEFP